jgi:hypothetical protein
VRPPRRLAALTAGVALLAAGCTSSGSHHVDDPVVSPPAITTAAPSTPAPSTPAPTTAAPTTAAPSSPASSSAAPTTAAARTTSAAPGPPRSTCTKLGIRVVPGGASVGQEIAALQFTNEGPGACTLVGYPAVTLLRSGRIAGRPSQPSTTATSKRTLPPGGVAESLLHDYVTNCQAPLSESLRVVAPGSSASLVRPFQLRVCVLRVDKLGAPD